MLTITHECRDGFVIHKHKAVIPGFLFPVDNWHMHDEKDVSDSKYLIMGMLFCPYCGKKITEIG